MTRQTQNERWINNPERRVGPRQMLRAVLAGMSETDPLYHEYRERLESRQSANRARNGRL